MVHDIQEIYSSVLLHFRQPPLFYSLKINIWYYVKNCLNQYVLKSRAHFERTFHDILILLFIHWLQHKWSIQMFLTMTYSLLTSAWNLKITACRVLLFYYYSIRSRIATKESKNISSCLKVFHNLYNTLL